MVNSASELTIGMKELYAILTSTDSLPIDRQSLTMYFTDGGNPLLLEGKSTDFEFSFEIILSTGKRSIEDDGKYLLKRNTVEINHIY